MQNSLPMIALVAQWWAVTWRAFLCVSRSQIARDLNYWRNKSSSGHLDVEEHRLAMQTALLMLRERNELPPNPRRA